jgi:hypothetical protein
VSANAILAFLSVSRIDQSWYKKAKPQDQLKQERSFGHCLWTATQMAMSTKDFLEKAWFYLHTFPSVLCILVLSTMLALDGILMDLSSTILAWFHTICCL